MYLLQITTKLIFSNMEKWERKNIFKKKKKHKFYEYEAVWNKSEFYWFMREKKYLLQMLDFIGTKHHKHTQSILQSTIDFKKKFANKWKSLNQWFLYYNLIMFIYRFSTSKSVFVIFTQAKMFFAFLVEFKNPYFSIKRYLKCFFSCTSLI